MAISDLPYGNLAHWGGKQECPGEALLEISSVLKPGSVVALIGPKKTKLEHPIPEKRKDKHRQRSGSYSQPEVSR
jgi:tRNA G10  N-methylase Trm11